MPRNRFFAALLAFGFALGSAFAGPGLFKKKVDPAQVPALVETLKSDSDEKRRKAAADELGGADPRLNPEVAAALTAALKKDAAAAVRVEAAESLGQLGQVFPVAGQALEAAAANDVSPAVRLAAKRTLWEYHLNGYRSPKGADGTAMQTEEPPIASPATPKPAPEVVPVAVQPVAPRLPPLTNVPPPSMGELPGVAPPPGPRLPRPGFLADLFPNSRVANRTVPPAAAGAPPILNLTEEPPIAKQSAVTIPPLPPPTSPVPPPTLTVEPILTPAPPQPDYVPTLPPFVPDLPPIVSPPDEEPLEVAPHPRPVIAIPPTLPPLK